MRAALCMSIGIQLAAIWSPLPAAAQFKVPDGLPPLPRDGQSCNDARTHCVVNATDWFAQKVAADFLAIRVAQLKLALEEAQAQRKHCAVVTPGALYTLFPTSTKGAAPR